MSNHQIAILQSIINSGEQFANFEIWTPDGHETFGYLDSKGMIHFCSNEKEREISQKQYA